MHSKLGNPPSRLRVGYMRLAPGRTDWLARVYLFSRWLKPKDAMYTADILPTINCAVTRQLLGDSWSNNGFCGPTEADTPLFVWLKEHGIDPASTGIDGIQGEGELTLKTPGRENYGSGDPRGDLRGNGCGGGGAGGEQEEKGLRGGWAMIG